LNAIPSNQLKEYLSLLVDTKFWHWLEIEVYRLAGWLALSFSPIIARTGAHFRVCCHSFSKSPSNHILQRVLIRIDNETLIMHDFLIPPQANWLHSFNR
jgi:hypothetical protein